MMLTVARKVHAPQRTPPCTAPACGPPFAHAGKDEDKNQQKKCDDRDVHRKSRGCAQQRTQVIQLITIVLVCACVFVLLFVRGPQIAIKRGHGDHVDGSRDIPRGQGPHGRAWEKGRVLDAAPASSCGVHAEAQ